MPNRSIESGTGAPILQVNDLRVAIHTEEGVVNAVRGISLEVRPGEVLGIVGESGCGKSVTAMSMIGLTLHQPNMRVGGSVAFEGRQLLDLSERELAELRGAGIAMIFQDPLTSLTPVHRVGDLIAETIRAHLPLSRADAQDRAVQMMREVGLPDPERRARAFPHELSGGMRQRVMIAMALACEPAVLIADEPTTALDVTIQAQILSLIRRLQSQRGTAVVIISHDLGVIAKMADRVAVMYAGRVVEQATVRDLFAAPQHPYTWGLLDSVPQLDAEPGGRLHAIPGQPPSLLGGGEPGCPFRPRCRFAHDRCETLPPLEPRSGPDHLDACWLDVDERPRIAGEHVPARA